MKAANSNSLFALWLLLVCTTAGAFNYAFSGSPFGTQVTVQGPFYAQRESTLRTIISAGNLPELRWPDFRDHRAQVKAFYEAAHYELAWLRDGMPTRQVQALIGLLQNAGSKGLRAEDYDGPRWAERLRLMDSLRPRVPDSDLARFDVALTVAVMRYVSDLYIGRVNPREVHDGVEINKFDIAAFITERMANAVDINAALEALEPPFPAYQRTLQALQTYMKLAREDDGELLPAPKKAIKPGEPYTGMPRLVRLLRNLGDLPAGTVAATPGFYEGALVDAVKHFQRRHGLDPDGQIGRHTIEELNVPLSRRVVQLQLALERWRWLPHESAQPPIMVNIPEFGLHAYNAELQWALSMKVVVGKAYRRQTPMFDGDLKLVIFRPPWNAPLSIQRSELVPKIQKDPHYLFKENFQITDRHGNVVSQGETDKLIINELRSGKLALKQRPGPKNSLGLVKFVFPNDHDVYMHGTPATSLFAKARRDFSHGCIRVEDPVALAAWVLRDKPEWTPEAIRAAMDGDNTIRVTLEKPIPVWIVYVTAVVMENGEVRFFDDIYKQDVELQEILERRYEYPE